MQPIIFKTLDCDICNGHPTQCSTCPLASKLSIGINELNEVLIKHAHEVDLIKHLFLEMESEAHGQ